MVNGLLAETVPAIAMSLPAFRVSALPLGATPVVPTRPAMDMFAAASARTLPSAWTLDALPRTMSAPAFSVALRPLATCPLTVMPAKDCNATSPSAADEPDSAMAPPLDATRPPLACMPAPASCVRPPAAFSEMSLPADTCPPKVNPLADRSATTPFPTVTPDRAMAPVEEPEIDPLVSSRPLLPCARLPPAFSAMPPPDDTRPSTDMAPGERKLTTPPADVVPAKAIAAPDVAAIAPLVSMRPPPPCVRLPPAFKEISRPADS
ncbi:hypothetical protein BOSP111201_04035 [Bordetella sputigena]